MTRQLKIAALALGILLASTSAFDAPLFAQERPPGKAKVVAEYCIYRVWPGCLEDLSDRTALATMTRVDMGNGIYIDTYRYEGLDPETGEPTSHMERVRNYRGLIPTRITFKNRYNIALEWREEADPDILRHYYILDFNYQYDTAQLAKAYARLLGGQSANLKIEMGYTWHEQYFCALIGPCSEAQNTRVDVIEGWPFGAGLGEQWVPRGEEVLETLDGPIRTLVFERPNPPELIWYDPVSEQVIQEAWINRGAGGKLRIHSRRVRILPPK